MFFQVGFTGAQRCKRAAFLGVIDHQIGHDTLGLNRATTGRVVARCGDLQARITAQGSEGLHRAFAKGLPTHDGGALMVLQGASHNFTGRCGAFIDQHDEWNIFQLRR